MVLILVFIGALIEGVLLLGQYFPGGFIIFLGVISAGKDATRAIEVVAVVSISFVIAYSINYLLGRAGWYLFAKKFGLEQAIENAKAKLVKHQLMAILSTYWEPNLASITATAAGVLQIPFKRFSFYSVVGILIWNTFWGTFVYKLGEQALHLAGFKYVLIVFGIWFAIILINSFVLNRDKATN
jgi:membrane protein DedA with SNARE-associated domain